MPLHLPYLHYIQRIYRCGYWPEITNQPDIFYRHDNFDKAVDKTADVKILFNGDIQK